MTALAESKPKPHVISRSHGKRAALSVSEARTSGQAGPVAIVKGTLPSYGGETHDLRRTRLAAAALLLAGAFGCLSIAASFWIPAHGIEITALWILRPALPAAVAAILFSRVPLNRFQLKTIEYALFVGLAILVACTQYYVNFELLKRGDAPAAVAYLKNGIIQVLAMMILAGTFLPNTAVNTAWLILPLVFSPIVGNLPLLGRPALAEALRQVREVEAFGLNLVYLSIGAVASVSAAHLFSRLRCELHQAKKFGQYELVRKLDEGGMGEVYLAEHQLLKRPCALKLIRAESGSDPLALARFEREVRSAAKLSHPNTIAIYDYGHTSDGTFYYVMEYLKGMDLAHLVKRFGPLPAGRVIRLFRQVCAALTEAHGLGLIHRDLKPGNLFVAARGGETDVAKVLDFGIVKITQGPEALELTSEQGVAGTPLYMAPEQSRGDRSIDARVDIYALGGMLYFALTGRPPFDGKTPVELMLAHILNDVIRPSTLVKGVPADLEEIVLRCLAKNPDDRFPNVRALESALARCGSAGDWDSERSDGWWADHMSLPQLDLRLSTI